MKKLLSIILTLVVINVFGQTFLPPRSSASTTVQDSRWRGLLTAYLPHTHGLTLNGGLDSVGAVFYDDSSRHIWMRDTSVSGGKVFSMLLKAGDAGVGTVTQVNAGFWMVPVSITTTGTINADSGAMAAYFPRRKDSTISFVTPTQMNSQGFLKTISGIAAGGDLAGTYPNPTISSNAVTFGKFQQIAAFSFVGNPTASPSNPQSSFFGYGLRWNNDTVKVDTSLLKSVFGSAAAGINQLTGDGTAGPGAGMQVFTLATVNSNVFGSNSFLKFSVNAKGLVTAAGSVGSSDIISALGYTPIQLSSLSSTAPIVYNSSTGNISMANSGVTAGPYTNANVTVNAQGLITSISSGSGGGGGGCLNCNADSLKKLPIDTSLRRNGYVLTFDSTNRKWVLSPNGSGSGAVSTVSNSDASLTISPTTGAVVASLNTSHANTWTGSPQVFNGGITMGNTIAFATTNTYQVGTSSVVASHVFSRAFNSDATATLASAAGSPVNISINSTPGITLLATGQAQLNNYTTSTSFTGTPLSFLQTDASGNIIQIPISSVGGTNVNIGSGNRWAVPNTNNIKTVFGSLIIIDSSTNANALTFTADTTSGGQKLATQGFVSRGFQPIGNYQGALSNTGSGFRVFSPQTGIKTLFCAGCTIDSSSNANSLTITVTAGGSGTVTNFTAGALSPLFTTSVATSSTTPALTFSLSNAGSNSVFGNNTGSSAAPAYFVPTATTLNGWFGGSIQGALSNVGSGFRIFSPQAGIKTLFCVGCTLDSTTNTNALTLTVSGSGLSGNGFVFQTASTTSYVSGSATNLIGYNASGSSSAIVLGTNLAMSGNTLNATGGLPALNPGDIFMGNGSSLAVDTPLKNDLVAMQEIGQWIAGKADTATTDSVAGYRFNTVDSIPYYYTTTGTGAEKGGWLTNSTSGDSIQMGPPVGVIIGNSLAAGHTALKGRLETGGGTGGFISNYPDSAGQFSYELRASTHMRIYNMGIGGQTTSQIRTRFLRDAIGLTINVGDGRPNQTLPRKPSFIIIEGAVNDFFNGVPLRTTFNNILWMVDICKVYDIPCVIMNSTGDAIANQQQLGWIRAYNDWLRSGVLSPYNCYVWDFNSFWNDPNYGNDNIHAVPGLTVDDIHLTKAGYAAAAVDLFNKAKLPVLDSVQFITAIATTNPIPNYNRPTSVAIGRGTPYAATYTLANSPVVTVPVTSPIMDSTWFTILASTNVTGTSTVTGFSSILFHIGNNPHHQVWYTRKTHFSGGFTGVLNSSNLNMQGKDGNGDTTIDLRLYDGVNRGLQVITNSGGTNMVINGMGNAAKLNNAALSIYNSSGTGIGTNGNIIATGGLNQIANLQINNNATASSTGRGISINNTGQSDVRFEANPTSGLDDFFFTYWNVTSKTVSAASSGSISHYHYPLGWTSFTTINQTANSSLWDPTLNNTGSFSGSLFVGLHYKPTVTSLNGATHYGLWIESGLTVLGSASGDPVLINTTTNNNGFLQIGANTTTVASMFLNGASSDVSSPTNGMLWYNSTTHALNFRDNGTTTNLLAGGGGSQTWQQTLTVGSTLNTTNSVTNTGQSFTWNNGGTGAFKFSGLLTDTTNAAYVLFKKKDSSVAEMTFANFAQYLPSDTLIVMNGLIQSFNTSGTQDTIRLGGSLSQNTSIALFPYNLSLGSGSTFIQIVTSSGSYIQTAGAIANSGWGTNTSTGNVTQTTSGHYGANFLDNPPSAQTSFTFTLPPSAVDGEIVNLHFGGTIANGSTVTSSFSVVVPGGSGMVIFGATPSATAISGDYLSWRFYAAGNAWYREH